MEALNLQHINPSLDFSQPQQFIDVGDTSFAYWKTGTGPDLVLIHGWPLRSATYRELVEHLKHQFTCHLFDLPGTGHTKTNPHTSHSFHNSAQSLRVALKKLNIKRYGIVAHDSGGAVARVLADIDSPKVSGLVLTGTEIPNYHSRLIRLLVGMGKYPKRFELFIRMMRYKSIRHSPFGFGGCFNNPKKIDGDFYNLFIKTLLENPKALHGQLQVLASMRLRDINKLQTLHRRLTMPVLLLWGERDPVFPLHQAKEMLNDLQKGELQVIPEGKLFIHEEYSELYSQHIHAFFEKTATKAQ